MKFRFRDKALERLYTDPGFRGEFPEEVVRRFRKRMMLISSAADERDFYQLKSLRFEKLKGRRKHQRSMRLNDRWRLIVEFEGSGEEKELIVVAIEDYH